MDYPDRIQAVVMIAPAIDPQNEKIWRISYPANRKIFRWMVPADWRATNDEKLSHVTELNLMLPLWKYIMCPVIFMYGKKDKIVPVANATFIQQVVEKEKLEILSWENEGHFIVWSEKDSIVQKLRQLLPR
jgi:pimeloyl-ACP methyl ester carboxylesterase